MYTITVLVACLALASATVWKDCGSKTGVVKNVNVPGCDAAPCVLKKGTTASVEIDGVTNNSATKVTASVHGVIGGIPVPFPIPQADGCQSGMTCPTAAGGEYKYNAQIEVKSMYPSIKVLVKWELKDENGADIACIILPAEIQG